MEPGAVIGRCRVLKAMGSSVTKLYKWQSEALEAWKTAGCRGIVNAVTGSGKTRLALAAAAQLAEKHSGLRIRIVAPTIALANQWRQSIVRTPEFSGVQTGFYGDGVRDDADSQIMIYVINSARAGLSGHMRRDFALGRHALLICDECHRYKSEQNRKIFGFIDRDPEAMTLYHALGLSATPFNGDNDDVLTRAIGDEIYRYDFSRAGRDETIAPYSVCQVATDFMSEEEEEYRELSDAVSHAYGLLLRERPHLKYIKGDAFIREVSRMAKESGMDPDDPAAAFLLLTYQRKEVSVLAESRIRCCAELVSMLRRRGRIIIFSERIEQAENIYRIISRKYGSIAGIYHSGMTKEARQRVLDDYRAERTGVLVSCKCLDEGLDVPDAGIGIVVSSSAVPRQRIQRLGRIVRNSESKESACLYYIYIRESKDDQAYMKLPDGDDSAGRVFDLRYYSRENFFSNDMYEYAASRLIADAKKKNADLSVQAELRSCILEGLCLPDYLSTDAALRRHIRRAGSVHEKNYYSVMRRIHESFTGYDQ